MKPFGPTIRKIRLAKGYTQKEVYTGIVSKTYAIQFEKGIHEMNIQDFQRVLEQLYMNMKEFLFILNDYQEQEGFLIDYQTSVHINQKEYRQVYDYAATLLNSRLKKDRITGIFAQLNAIRVQNEIEHTQLPYPPKLVAELKIFLIEVDTWTMNEIVLFHNTSFAFDTETLLLLASYCVKGTKKYLNLKSALDVTTTFLYSTAVIYLEHLRLDEAQECIRLLEKQPIDTRHLLQKILLRFLQILETTILEKSPDRGMAEVDELAKVFSLIDLEAQAQDMKELTHTIIQLYCE